MSQQSADAGEHAQQQKARNEIAVVAQLLCRYFYKSCIGELEL